MLKESADLLNKANDLDFETVDEYFAYFIDSVINGQRQQAKDLYSNLSDVEKEEFKDWFEDNEDMYDSKTIADASKTIFGDVDNDSDDDYDDEELDEISLAGLGNIGKKIWDKASDKADNFVNATRDKVDSVVDKAKEVGAGISKEYNKGVASDTEKKLIVQMEKVKNIIIKYNETAKKAGIPSINPRKMMGILNTIPKA
jgi:hypothetical protein